jgi:hypothetical protein
MNNHDVRKWISDNLWNLAVTVFFVIMAYAALEQKVIQQQSQLNALEQKVGQYPSADYFNLKFKNIDDSLNEIKQKLDQHITQTR